MIQKDKILFPQLGLGLGLRPEHFDQISNGESRVQWFEILTENYLGISGHGQSPLLAKLLRLAEIYPIVFHCVSMNIGSVDNIDLDFLKQIKELKKLVNPKWISDHLCWTGVDNKNTHELLPLPYTQETINHVSQKINQIQDFFGERILIENTSSYITYKDSELEEWEFISEIVNKTDCGILLDINNIYVSSVNHNFNPKDFINNIPLNNVGQIHLAGHRKKKNGLIVDTHDDFVCDEVYELLKYFLTLSSLPATMVEWDDNIPDLKTYEEEVLRINQFL